MTQNNFDDIISSLKGITMEELLANFINPASIDKSKRDGKPVTKDGKRIILADDKDEFDELQKALDPEKIIVQRRDVHWVICVLGYLSGYILEPDYVAASA